MPLPTAWTMVRVYGTYLRIDGTPNQGSVKFELDQRVVITDGTGTVIGVIPRRQVVELDATGAFEIYLPATDDPAISPTGWTYQVTEGFNGGDKTGYSIEVPVALATEGINLVQYPHATPVPVNPPVVTYLRVQDIGVMVASQDDMQHAIDVSNSAASQAAAAVTTANAASDTANNALTVANGIDAKATTALAQSSAAVATANAASDTANAIAGTANTALANSEDAVDTANQALAALGPIGTGDAMLGKVLVSNGANVPPVYAAFQQVDAGSVPRPPLVKMQEISVSPEDFGAVGDGGTDDTAALTAALATGKNVELGAKVYLTGPLKLNSYQKIYGKGIWKSQLKAKSNCPAGYLISLASVNVYAASVVGLTVNCNAAAQTNTVSGIGFDNTGGTGFPFGDPKHTIADCYVVGSNGTGYLIGVAARGSTLRSLYANQCTVAGYEISTTDSFIEDCVAGACGTGINSHGANNRHIGLKAFGSTVAGVQVGGQRDTWINCEAQDNAGAGFTLASGDRDLTLIGCLADSNQTYGFNLQSAIGAKLVGVRSITRGGGAYTQAAAFNYGAATRCYVQGKASGNTAVNAGTVTNNTTLVDDGSGQDFRSDSNVLAQQGESTEVAIGSLGGVAGVRLGGDMALSRVSSSVANLNGGLQLASAATVRSGNGIPSNSVGANGDLYVRQDGTAGSYLYGKFNGVWVDTNVVSSFKNKLINGNFDFWQRGTSLAAAAALRFIADRWITSTTGSTIAPSQQPFTLGQTSVPGEPTNFHRSVVASVAGASNFANFVQRIESVRTLAGKTVTLSFWAKADAAKNIAFDATQAFGFVGSPSASVTGIGVSTFALTTAWQKFTATFTIPSIAGKTLGTDATDWLALTFWFDAGSSFNSRTNSLGQQSGTFDIAQVQLEEGAVATPFEVRPAQIELALCYRFYRKLANTARTSLPMGMCFSTTTVLCNPAFEVDMRAAPSVTLNGTWRALMNGSSNSVSSFSVSEVSTQTCTITATITGGTVGQAAIIQGNDGQGAAANVEFNAEL